MKDSLFLSVAQDSVPNGTIISSHETSFLQPHWAASDTSHINYHFNFLYCWYMTLIKVSAGTTVIIQRSQSEVRLYRNLPSSILMAFRWQIAGSCGDIQYRSLIDRWSPGEAPDRALDGRRNPWRRSGLLERLNISHFVEFGDEWGLRTLMIQIWRVYNWRFDWRRFRSSLDLYIVNF